MAILDYILVFGFLIITIVIGCFKLTKIEHINVFALGKREFSGLALTFTIIATWASGSGFIIDITEFYTNGILYLIPVIGMCIGLVILSLLIVPRMERFLGKNSVAVVIGESYGYKLRLITAICAIFAMIASVSIQIKVFSRLGYYVTGYDGLLCPIICTTIIVFYTFMGGVKSVVYTDIIQGICLILSLIIIISVFYNDIFIIHQGTSIPDLTKFSFKGINQASSKEIMDSIFLGLYFIFPGMSACTVQRICMGRNIKQVQRSWLISAISLFMIISATCYLSYLIYHVNPNLKKQELLNYLIDCYTLPGTKAIVIIGIIAMAMSTADSYLNMTSVLIANDTWKMNRLSGGLKLTIAKYSCIFIGSFAFLLTFIEDDLLSFVLLTKSFYIPLITPLLLFLIFGKIISEKKALIIIGITFIFIVTCHLIKTSFQPLIPGLILNIVMFIIAYNIERFKKQKNNISTNA